MPHPYNLQKTYRPCVLCCLRWCWDQQPKPQILEIPHYVTNCIHLMSKITVTYRNRSFFNHFQLQTPGPTETKAMIATCLLVLSAEVWCRIEIPRNSGAPQLK